MKRYVDAVVLAGGKGTRLAPLTEDTPKPMLKIMGKTVLENVFDRIADAGIHRTFVTTMYLPWQIENCGTQYRSTNISYVREKEPLGTAGSVAAAYDGNAEAVLVLSGDGMYDFDLKKIIDFHFEKNADVTIVTYSTDNPLDYGVVLYNDDGRITRFEEKPPWAKVISGKVNTGIYVINRDILGKIPTGCQYDFSKQLFPLLLAQNKAMYAYEAKGIWHDIGNLDQYFEANKTALDGKVRGFENNGLTMEELTEQKIDAEAPVYVSRKAIIGANVKLGAYTVIGDNAVISDNCDISCSVISDGVTLGMGCGIYGSIIGRNTKFGENCITSEGCVIGANSTAEEGVILPKYSFIHSSKRISSGEYRSTPCGKREKNLFTDNGICCDVSKTSPEYLIHIGSSAASVLLSKKSGGSVRIGIMTDDNNMSKRAGGLILEGVRSSGVRSMDFGCGYESMARFAASEFITDIVIYVNRSKDGHVYTKIFDAFGLPVPDRFERDFTIAFFSHNEYLAPERFYEVDRMNDISTLYYSNIIKRARTYLPNGNMDGFVCSFGNIGNIRAYSPSYTAICAITELGGSITRKPENTNFCFEIDDEGLAASCISRSSTFDDNHINAAILAAMKPEKKGEELYFASSMPDTYKIISEKNGYTVKEYSRSSVSDAEKVSPDAVKKLSFLEDGVLKLLYFAILLYTGKADLNTLSSTFPSFEVYSKLYEYTSDRAHIMQRLAKLSRDTLSSKDPSRDGVRLIMSNGSITVIPGKISGFKVISEAASAEAAKELCDKAEEFLK